VEPEPKLEEVSSVEAEPSIPTKRPSFMPEILEEGFQPSDFSFFKDEFLEDFGNTSKYSCQKRSLVLVTPLDPLDDAFLKDSIRELTTIMSSEWVEEAKLSSKVI
jgi:hypothetical protein